MALGSLPAADLPGRPLHGPQLRRDLHHAVEELLGELRKSSNLLGFNTSGLVGIDLSCSLFDSSVHFKFSSLPIEWTQNK